MEKQIYEKGLFKKLLQIENVLYQFKIRIFSAKNNTFKENLLKKQLMFFHTLPFNLHSGPFSKKMSLYWPISPEFPVEFFH